jgi:hypothetical protein
MGAELMSFIMSVGVPLWEPAYQPRHSSPRRRRGGSGRLVQALRGAARFGRMRRPEPPYLSAPLETSPLAAALEMCIAAFGQDPTLEMPAVPGDGARCPCPCNLVRPYVLAASAGF